MFFEPYQRKIYSPESMPDLKLDPLAVDRALVRHSKGTLDQLLQAYQPDASSDGVVRGDINQSNKVSAAVARADAEEQLVAIARQAFGLADSPECMDAEVLEVLHDYLWWMEKKGRRGETPPTSRPATESAASGR